jgi:drug/metabolite transporter (DMT)-like permease
LADVPLRLWGVLAISAFTGLLFSHVLLYRAIQYVGPVVTSGATCVQPFVTAFGAWLLLGEVLLPSQWVGGCALVGSSLILLSLRLKARGPVVPPVAVSTEPLPEDAA